VEFKPFFDFYLPLFQLLETGVAPQLSLAPFRSGYSGERRDISVLSDSSDSDHPVCALLPN
jgi:hypothetical protein